MSTTNKRSTANEAWERTKDTQPQATSVLGQLVRFAFSIFIEAFRRAPSPTDEIIGDNHSRER